MKISLKQVTLIGVAVLVGVSLVALLAGPTLAQGPGPWAPRGGYGWRGHGPMMGGWQGMGPGMMGGWRGAGPGTPGRGVGGEGCGYGIGPTPSVTSTVPYGYGPGTCPGMSSPGWEGYGFSGGERLTMEQAAEAAEDYLAAYSGANKLMLGEVMEFNYNFYAQVVEEETGIGAFEILIDPVTGTVHPEPGPNMMWNLKYGHMGGRGMMGGLWGYGTQAATADMPVGAQQAQGYAQSYLDAYLPGTTADDHADPFYGYYTLHVLQDDQVVGMLSVNGFTGQVWYHSWHGDLVGMTEGHAE